MDIQTKHAHGLSARFGRAASRLAIWVGSPTAFALALACIALWAALGPSYRYSDTWQLVVNTGTTVITFLMVFLIQNTQNRDARAIHLKLDEVIRSIRAAHNEMIDIEKLPDADLEVLAKQYELIRQEQQSRRKRQPIDPSDRGK
jgi:low affinity Fe/Cu permease